jgi:hypothetical protein
LLPYTLFPLYPFFVLRLSFRVSSLYLFPPIPYTLSTFFVLPGLPSHPSSGLSSLIYTSCLYFLTSTFYPLPSSHPTSPQSPLAALFHPFCRRWRCRCR